MTKTGPIKGVSPKPVIIEGWVRDREITLYQAPIII